VPILSGGRLVVVRVWFRRDRSRCSFLPGGQASVGFSGLAGAAHSQVAEFSEIVGEVIEFGETNLAVLDQFSVRNSSKISSRYQRDARVTTLSSRF
jgi:hypothetical protein